MKIQDGQQVNVAALSKRNLQRAVMGLAGDNQKLAIVASQAMNWKTKAAKNLKAIEDMNMLGILARPGEVLRLVRDCLAEENQDPHPRE